uniref:Uncharacterized protein n=1 Tax=Bactrocera dorsalis TaxID=27457 RepID=A0A034W8A0_BACDO
MNINENMWHCLYLCVRIFTICRPFTAQSNVQMPPYQWHMRINANFKQKQNHSKVIYAHAHSIGAAVISIVAATSGRLALLWIGTFITDTHWLIPAMLGHWLALL